MDQYDEDLYQNPFFQNLKNKHEDLFEIAASKRWTICVPRVGSLGELELSRGDLESHILIPTEDDVARYKTVSNKEVLIKGSTISTHVGFLEQRLVPILFEETYYNKKDESHCVLCINQPLEGGDASADIVPDRTVYRSSEECANLLWGSTGNPKTRKQLGSLIDAVHKRLNHMEKASLKELLITVKSFFDKAMDIIHKDPYMKKSSSQDLSLIDSVRHAVETHLMYGVHKRLFKMICTCLATKNAQLNKITRNLSHIQLQHLGVRMEYCQNVPRARKELSNLTLHRTPHGKLTCIKRVVTALTRPAISQTPKSANPAQLTTDDLLPILVFLVLKADIPNWWAHFEHMSSFRFARSSLDNEYGFYMASLEAALVHVSGGRLLDLECSHQLEQRPAASIVTDSLEPSLWHKQDQDNRAVDQLFQFVRERNKAALLEILQKSSSRRARLLQGTTSPPAMTTALCHPLCTCDKCRMLQASSANEKTGIRHVTVHSRDAKGYTVLHAAAFYGHVEMADIILQQGALVDGCDYLNQTPLHIACRRGYQAVVLLVLHHGADINVRDGESNTPLHLAALNGHDDCVKALVFFAQGSCILNVNATNDFGDTALHLATKWGYFNLVCFLLDNGASALIKNRKHHDALRYSHSNVMSEELSRAAMNQAERNLLRRQTAMRKTMSMNDFVQSGQHYNGISGASQTDHNGISGASQTDHNGMTRSMFINPSQQSFTPKVTRAASIGNISGDKLSQNKLSGRRRSSDTSNKGIALTNKKIDKLLKAVTDGDINLARFHLGWTSDSEDEEEANDLDLSEHELCHPLCQCRRCMPKQKLTVPSTKCAIHVNSSDLHGYTPLHTAVLNGHVGLVELFLRRGANVNSRTFGMESTPLHLACKQRKTEIIEILLSHGAEVDAQDSDGNTPLHHCCMLGNEKKTELVLKHNALVNLANHKGNMPLHDAVRWNFRHLVRLLLSHGALPQSRNADNKLPLHYSNTESMCDLLRKAMSNVRLTGDAKTPCQNTDAVLGNQPPVFPNSTSGQNPSSVNNSLSSSFPSTSGQSNASSSDTITHVMSPSVASSESVDSDDRMEKPTSRKSPTSVENLCTVDGNFVSVYIPTDENIAKKRASFGESFGDGLTIIDNYFESEPIDISTSLNSDVTHEESDCYSENSNTESQQDMCIE